MLEFFRLYQRYFFIVITVVVISSFTFFGTYSTFGGAEERPDRAIGRLIDGSSMMRSDVQKLSRFIATDREDSIQGRGLSPNFCNDGVIRYDFIKDGLAKLIVAEYFDALKGDLESRLDKVKRFKPYAHPDAPFLSAKTVWDHFIPELNIEISDLQKETEVTLPLFSRLERLYQFQSKLQPEMLRRILIYQHRQYPWLTLDQRLPYEDLALFGFHSASDWFGNNFVDLISEFILNAAVAAEEKGYRVSLEEAKGDLIHTFQESMNKLNEGKTHPQISFPGHLRSLGFDERSASEVWRKVLLFRRYFQDVGEAAFVDKLPYKDFAGYAKEEAIVHTYNWPLVVRNAQDLAELQYYIKAVCPNGMEVIPSRFLSVEEVEKKHPNLVQRTYRAKVAEVSKKQVALRATVKQVWDWQTEDTNWNLLKAEFSLPSASNRDERFKILQQIEPHKRAEIDVWSRGKIVDQNPTWIEEALSSAAKNEKTWNVSANEEPNLKAEGIYFLIEGLELIREKHILTFSEARPILSKLVSKVEGELKPDQNPFFAATQQALSDLKNNKEDSRWVQTGSDPLLDQFKLERKEQAILRTSKEDWMKEQAFLMLPDFWSPIHVADNGQIVFFYLQEKKVNPAPILDQLAFGKETLAADAKAFVTEKLIQVVKKKNAIVIPVQKEDE
jgi:hypothetical protein